MTSLSAAIFRCPFCGERDETEFRYGGDPAVSRPDAAAGDGEWATYLHMRENRRGLALEFWVHAKGCGSWLVVERDTVTHAIRSIAEAAP